MMPVALALHHLGVRLVHEPPGVRDRLLGRGVEAPVRHVDHPQPVLRAPIDGLGHHHHLVEGDGHGALVPEEDHAAGVGHAKDVDAELVGDDGAAVVVDRHLHDLFALAHLAHQGAQRDLSSPLRCLCHRMVPPRSFLDCRACLGAGHRAHRMVGGARWQCPSDFDYRTIGTTVSESSENAIPAIAGANRFIDMRDFTNHTISAPISRRGNLRQCGSLRE